MRDLLNKVTKLRREATEEEVTALINDLGPTPSIPVLEAVLKHYKEVEKEILTKDLLEWMQENDLTTFENDEYKVGISTFVSAKVEDQEAAFSWLQSHNYGDLIKDTAEFPKGEFSDAVKNALDELGVSYTKKSGIHPQSLKKIMRDRLEAEDELPDEDDGFKIDYFDEARVKEK